jgi:hypothetical protein
VESGGTTGARWMSSPGSTADTGVSADVASDDVVWKKTASPL